MRVICIDNTEKGLTGYVNILASDLVEGDIYHVVGSESLGPVLFYELKEFPPDDCINYFFARRFIPLPDEDGEDKNDERLRAAKIKFLNPKCFLISSC